MFLSAMDYWQSQGRKFCDFCKCWIADNRASIDFHENGKKHKENVSKRVKQIYKNSTKQAKIRKKFESDLENMEKAAMAAYVKDVEGNTVDITAQEIMKNKCNRIDEPIAASPNQQTLIFVILPHFTGLVSLCSQKNMSSGSSSGENKPQEKAEALKEQRANAEREKYKALRLQKATESTEIGEVKEEKEEIPYRRDYSVPDKVDPLRAHWPVYQVVSEVYILVPALLGLKGNLEMTLASRLSTHANLGHMDTQKHQWTLIIGNSALIQCQSMVVGLLASLAAVIFGWIPEAHFNIHHGLLLCASALVTASVASFLLGLVMVAVILLSKRMNINS
ncbi:hypothetical protein KQX54_000690 [Cotesia glomerata]|uniref:Matrin-type domain-containing protein n=1 Tax=Cotesia glomerata TaxID=32391 RepID=A0AAV7ITG9_COTGL|nr:hypothetical protein KQX54_000690 [Cotesia glomerata]